jgi:hypothetical protein
MTLREIVRAVGELGISYVRWILSALALALVLVVFDWLKRRFWPTPEDPERRAQAKAWAALIAEAEERTRERHPRDPHTLTLTDGPHDPGAEADADTVRKV